MLIAVVVVVEAGLLFKKSHTELPSFVLEWLERKHYNINNRVWYTVLPQIHLPYVLQRSFRGAGKATWDTKMISISLTGLVVSRPFWNFCGREVQK